MDEVFCRYAPRSGIYVVWALDELVKLGVSFDSAAVDRRRLAPRSANELDHGVPFPLKAESEGVNHTWEGKTESCGIGMFECSAEADDSGAHARALKSGVGC